MSEPTKNTLFGRNNPEAEARRKESVRRAMADPEVRARLKAALKAKWASGTRKPSPRSAYEKAGITIRKTYAEGRAKLAPKEIRIRNARMGGSTRSKNQVDQVTKLGFAKKGVPNVGRAAAVEENIFAKVWELRCPRGRIYKFKNLALWARRNAHRFEDTRPYSKHPLHKRICFGISNAASDRGRVHHYRGWTILSKLEKAHLGGADLLGRDRTGSPSFVPPTGGHPDTTTSSHE